MLQQKLVSPSKASKEYQGFDLGARSFLRLLPKK
jgi:hypothetical protein